MVAHKTVQAKHPAHNAYPPHVIAFAAMALPAAQDVNKKWGVPASVVIAQSALESGWGKHVVQNAYFGIKGHAPSGNSATFETTEVINGKVVHIKDKFRAYTDYGDAADDYGRFLNENSNYKAAFNHKDDPIQFVEAVAKGGYATDPNYAKTLRLIIKAYNLHQYDK
jgi:flagellum-specific peptidoglycan hydrolase FlgJ